MRSRPPAAIAAMIVAALWLLVCGVLHAMTGIIVPPLFSVAPLIVATVADERRTAIKPRPAWRLPPRRRDRHGAGRR